MNEFNRQADPVGLLAWMLFALRVGGLALFGATLAYRGLDPIRDSYLALGTGLMLCSVAGYFWFHPRRSSRSIVFMASAVTGFLLVALGFALGPFE